MASGYLYRSGLLERVVAVSKEAPVVLWGPPGFGKTLLLKEVARRLELPYRTEPEDAPAAYDLEKPPEAFVPGAVYALPARPRVGPEAVLLGPEALAFDEAEVRELARRLGVPRLARPAWEQLGGWPALVRRGLEQGVADPSEEPLRGYLEAHLAALPPDERELLWLLVLALPEPAWRRAGWGKALDALLERGWATARDGRVHPLPAVAHYLRAARGWPPYARVAGALEAARELDPEAALEGYLRYRRPEAGQAFERLAEHLLPRGAFDRLMEAWGRLPKTHRTPRGALQAARAERSRGRLESALALARSAIGEPGLRAEARDVEGSVLIHLGRYREAADAFREGLAHADDELRPRMLAGLGAALIRDGRFSEAVRVLERVVGGERPLDAPVLARAEHNLGIALHHLGHLERAVAAYQEALGLKADQGPLTQANTLLSMGEALRLLGRFEDAHRTLKSALEKAEEAREYRAIGYSALNLGDLYTDAGWFEAAAAAYRRAEEVLRLARDPYGLGLLFLGRGRLYRRRGARAAARHELNQAEAVLKEGGSPAELAEVYLERALLGGPGRRRWLKAAEAAARATESQRILARVWAERVLVGELGEEAAARAAAFALEEDPLLALEGRYLPVWAAGGDPGQALLERLALGFGRTQVYSFGETRIVREGETLRFPTSKEVWVLLHFWLRPGEDPAALFAGAKNPAKRLQIAVHHLRSRLGEDWVQTDAGGYRARPLPGVWWDAALFEAARPHAHLAPIRAFLRTLYRGPLAPGAPFSRERRRFARFIGNLSK